MLAATPFKAVSQFVLLNLIFPSLFPLFKKKKLVGLKLLWPCSPGNHCREAEGNLDTVPG